MAHIHTYVQFFNYQLHKWEKSDKSVGNQIRDNRIME